MALQYNLNDPLEGARWTQTGPGGGLHEATVTVEGFASTAYYDMVVELYADPGLPQMDDPPPRAGLEFMRLREWGIREVICTSPRSITLDVRYQQQTFLGSTRADSNGPVIFRMSSRDVGTEQWADKDGVAIYAWDGSTPDEKSYVVPRTQMVYDCERYEDDDPEPRARPLIGKLNRFTWNGRPPRTVLFSEFSADTRDNGATYLCYYSFAYDADTHDPVRAWTGKDGKRKRSLGNQPPDPLPTNAAPWIRPQFFPDADFSPLNISI